MQACVNDWRKNAPVSLQNGPNVPGLGSGILILLIITKEKR